MEYLGTPTDWLLWMAVCQFIGRREKLVLFGIFLEGLPFQDCISKDGLRVVRTITLHKLTLIVNNVNIFNNN